jgi:hypothetical protein
MLIHIVTNEVGRHIGDARTGYHDYARPKRHLAAVAADLNTVEPEPGFELAETQHASVVTKVGHGGPHTEFKEFAAKLKRRWSNRIVPER